MTNKRTRIVASGRLTLLKDLVGSQMNCLKALSSRIVQLLQLKKRVKSSPLRKGNSQLLNSSKMKEKRKESREPTLEEMSNTRVSFSRTKRSLLKYAKKTVVKAALKVLNQVKLRLRTLMRTGTGMKVRTSCYSTKEVVI